MALARLERGAPTGAQDQPIAVEDAPGSAAPAPDSGPIDAPAWLTWLETLVVTAAVPALGHALHRGDPLFASQPFAWPLVAPLLVGLRHGFAPGFASALALVLALEGLPRVGLATPAAHPMQLVVGWLFVGMAAGEFSQRSRRALESMRAHATEQRARLDELERSMALLRLSHDRLEHQAASGTASLRAAITDVRARFSRSSEGAPPFFGREREIISLLARFAAVQVASLHAVVGGRALPAAHRLGDVAEGIETDLLCREALRVRAVVSVHDFAARGGGATRLLAAVPLIDVRGRVRGLVAVREIPFAAFTHDALKLLAVVAGHLADALSEAAEPIESVDDDRRAFEDGLRRCLDDRRQQGLPAAVCAIAFAASRSDDGLVETLRALHRGPDRVWLRVWRGRTAAWLLLPLTDESGLAGFRARLKILCEATAGGDDGSIRVHARLLEERDDAEAVLAELATWSKSAAMPMVRVAGA